MRLKGQVAIVTGAGRGIGRATAQMLASEGAAVALLARTAEEIERGAAEIKERFKTRAVAVRCDITSEEQVEQAIGRVRHELGRVDLLVNNAGYGRRAETEAITLDDWQRQIAVPASVRRQLGIKPGDRLEVEVEDSKVVLRRVRARSAVDELVSLAPELWRGIDTDRYIDELRSEWTHREL